MTTSKTPAKQFRNRDIFLSSAALALTREEPTMERERDMVIFVHEATDALSAAVATYLSNGNVPVQDFVAAYKRLRTMMYQVRG